MFLFSGTIFRQYTCDFKEIIIPTTDPLFLGVIVGIIFVKSYVYCLKMVPLNRNMSQ
jgi:hypothetical protein